MSRKTFWCIVVTAGGGAALMFAVKLAENFKNFEKFFFSKKIFFRLEKHFKVVSALKSRKKIFFGSNRPSGFCVLKISPLLNDLEISIN